jgi:hypothetical protein
MSHLDPIDDVEVPEITEEYVTKCVDDWLYRLDDLLWTIKGWAVENGWSAEDGESVPMREELMGRFNIRDRSQPSLFVRSPDGAEVLIQPKGLWVIGANSRVDLFSAKGVYALVDIADRFQPPRWILHQIGKQDGKPFVPARVSDIA